MSNAAPLILVPRGAKLGEGFTRSEKVAALEHPGRRTDGSQSAASWLSDLTDLRKTILLCSAYCAPKFNPRRHGYRRYYAPDITGQTDGYMSNGKCDGCKQQTVLLPGGGRTFIPDETYRLTCIDPLDARREARARAGVKTAWERITSMWGSRGPREAATRKGA